MISVGAGRGSINEGWGRGTITLKGGACAKLRKEGGNGHQNTQVSEDGWPWANRSGEE